MTKRQVKPDDAASEQSCRVACSACGMGKVCIPAGLSREDMLEFEKIVHKSKPLHRGEFVYRRGDPLHSVAAVRSGCFKSYVIDEGGNEHVLGFHFPGELLGLDAIYTKKHVCDVVALDTSCLCRLPYTDVTKLAARMPDLQTQLFRTMSQRIGDLNTVASDFTADQRMAAFLLTLSVRFKLRGYSERSFNLAMSRRDVGNYLRMAQETVSRVLARFQDQGLIRINRRLVEILEHDDLHLLAGSAFCDSQNRI